MSFNSDLKKVELHMKQSMRSRSGAVREIWSKQADILISIYEVSAFQVIASAKYEDISHRAVTFAGGIQRGQKIVDGEREYQILQVLAYSNRTTLLLREVMTGA